MEAHDVTTGLMQDQPQNIEVYQTRQTFDKIMKKLRQVTVRGD
jgi:hypothetical protein